MTEPPASETPAPEPPASRAAEIRSAPVRDQQEYLLALLTRELDLDEAARTRVDAILRASTWLGFGNPKLSQPTLSPEQCRARRSKVALPSPDPRCGAPNMVGVPGPGETPATATLCIDQYEFPNVPCEYPVVWVRASEAEQLCRAVGKRLCDAHEWEGACAGRRLDPEEDYAYDRVPKAYAVGLRTKRRLHMEYQHNVDREITWAYGKQVDHARCGTHAKKTPACNKTIDWSTCGTPSFPLGAHVDCVSPLGVYDQHGNVAEHMSLPLYREELATQGGLGWTEMKGSWFVFSSAEAHADDCRWRARNWHTTRVADANSHRNYHLGFRCCRDVAAPAKPSVR